MRKRGSYSTLDNSNPSDLDDVQLSSCWERWLYKFQNLSWGCKVGIVVAVALIIFLVVLAVVIPLAVMAKEDDNHSSTNNKPLFNFDDIFSLGSKSIGIRWLSQQAQAPQPLRNLKHTRTSMHSRALPKDLAAALPSSFLYMQDGCVYVQGVTSNTTTFPSPSTQKLVANLTDLKSKDSSLYTGFYSESPSLSQDASTGLYVPRYLLLAKNYRKQWRHSFFATFLLWDVEKQQLSPLDPFSNDTSDMNPLWSPDGTSVAFVRGNNIYLKNITDSQPPIAVSTDGTPARMSDGLLIENGVQTWVYEEEVFSAMSAMWWSPDGKHISYLSFDSTQVPQFLMPVYDNVYPTIINIPYPKPGYPNPIVSVRVYDLQSTNTTKVPLPSEVDSGYVTGVFWVNANILAVRTLNRLQNMETLYAVTIADYSIRTLTTHTSTAWLDTGYDLTFLEDTNGQVNYFVDLRMNSKGYYQIALFEFPSGQFLRLVTDDQAEWAVTGILQWDPYTNTLYYQSTEGSVLERHIYSISIEANSTNSKKKLTPYAGMWRANFAPFSSAGGALYVLYFDGNGTFTDVPYAHLKDTANEAFSVNLVNNSDLATELAKRDMPSSRYLTVPSADPDIKLNAVLTLPPRFSSDKKYPLLVDVYGGPGSQAVYKTFRLGFDVYLASLGYIVAQVDGRGTSTQNAAFMYAVYKQLGILETQDQIAAAKHYQTLPYVDAKKLAIWGWSYGGYMTGMVMTDPNSVFKLGMSVAPVTDWRYYDSVYTERYMTTPEANVGGYTNGSVVNRAENLKDRKYLLVHGTADDNVHMQNSLELSKQLVKKGIAFQEMLYTNSDHGISTDNARPHLYHLLQNFLSSNIDL